MGVTFTENSAFRIARTVREVEGSHGEINIGRRIVGMLPQLVFVLVQQNGGNAGSSTATIDATYNIYQMSDAAMANPLNSASSPLSPLFNRAISSPPSTPVAVAAAGSIAIACMDANNNYQLLLVAETPTWVTC